MNSVCNSIKHAFPEESGGRIVISVEKAGAFDYQLFYGDNGVGCSSKSTRSLGLDLVLC
jgi:two-component sensor histidine kinase